MKNVKIIIAGGRDFNNYEFLKQSVFKVLYDLDKNGICNTLLYCERILIEIISGNAKGADSLGEKFAEEFNYNLKKFPANWDLYGKKAGLIRNEQMAKYAKKDDNYSILIAFWDSMSRGTKHMIDTAKENNFDEVYVFNY